MVARRVNSSEREPSRFAAGSQAAKRRRYSERLGLPARCGRGPSAVQLADRELSQFAAAPPASKLQPNPEPVCLLTRCGRGPSAVPARLRRWRGVWGLELAISFRRVA